MFLRVLLITALVMFVLQLRAAPASALSMCGKYRDLATSLRTVYGEKPLASGTSRAGKAYMEFWASEAGTWTILLVAPNGVSCITNAGRDFDLVRTSVRATPES